MAWGNIQITAEGLKRWWFPDVFLREWSKLGGKCDGNSAETFLVRSYSECECDLGLQATII